MKTTIGLLITLLLCGCRIYGAQPQPVTYTVETTIITNTVSEGEYDARTNGNVRTDVRRISPYVEMQWAASVTNVTSFNQYYVPGLMGASSPDPFQEKVTVTYYSEERQDTYFVQVGPITEKYATQWTALSRWKTVHKQKLNMQESVETLRE